MQKPSLWQSMKYGYELFKEKLPSGKVRGFLIIVWGLAVLLSVCLLVVYIQMKSGITPIVITMIPVELVFRMLRIQEVTVEKIEVFLNIYLGLTGVLFTFSTAYSQFSKGYELKRNLPIKSMPTIIKGVHDIRIMKKEFQGASCVAIFSGSFDWIFNEGMFKTLCNLADENNLYLYTSNNDISAVKANIRKKKPTTSEISDDEIETVLSCLKFSDKSNNLKCSIIHKNNSSSFLYKHLDKVYILEKKHFGIYLLDAIDMLAGTASSKKNVGSVDDDSGIP